VSDFVHIQIIFPYFKLDNIFVIQEPTALTLTSEWENKHYLFMDFRCQLYYTSNCQHTKTTYIMFNGT